MEGSPRISRLRLHRSVGFPEETLFGDPARLLHSFSRLGLWAKGLTAAIRAGEISADEVAKQLELLGEFGDFAFDRWCAVSSSSGAFDSILREQLIPDFCSKPTRGFGPDAYTTNGISVSSIDAQDFCRAWDGGLLTHLGGGRYRAPASGSPEQFFWSGPKHAVPRKFTLWHEPVITMATLARLHWDLGWPKELLGTQSKDGAFDVFALNLEKTGEQIAGEVKRTVSEVETLLTYMREFGSAPNAVQPASGRGRNAYRKVAGLRARKAPVFWAIGPAGYSKVFRIVYQVSGELTLEPADAEVLSFDYRSTEMRQRRQAKS
jgi:hypothetical protein